MRINSLVRVRCAAKATRVHALWPDPFGMGTHVLSMRIDGELLDRLRIHAAKRGMSVQDYVVRTLIRDDFDERLQAAAAETEKFYGAA